ncbi:MAG: tetratricopeptide repeat protein [Flavobacteriales bacterium]|nr:tetratricopeptide repeat protein [Flavobacteriales bacterium]
MIRKLCILFFVLASSKAFAVSTIDSLLQITSSTQPDSIKVDAYNDLIWEYYGYNNDSALYYGNQSIRLATAIDYKKGLANAHRYVGNVYELISNYARALQHQQISLEIAESIHFKPAIASSLSNIGSIYERINDYKKALSYLERSLKLCIELDQKEGIAAVYGNIGNIYFNIKAFTKSLECYKTSLKMNEEIGNLYGIAVSKSNIGNIYIEQKKYREGIEQHLSSLEIRTQINHRQGMASSMASLGICYQAIGDIQKAKEYFAQSALISDEVDDVLSGMKANKGLYEISKENKNYPEALRYHEEFFRLNDSVFNANRNEEITNLRTKFALDQQQKELDTKAEAEKIKLQAEADADHQRQQIIIYASVAILVTLIVFLLFLFNRFQVTRRQKLIIEEQKKTVEESNKQITDSINYARRIQEALLPSEHDLKSQFNDSFLLFKPKDIVSGDFFWISDQGNHIFFALADCTGHGVPGGFMSMLGTSFLNEIINEKKMMDPGSILDLLRERVIAALRQQGNIAENKDGMDIVLCRYNKNNKQLCYAAANNHFYAIKNNVLLECKGDKMPIGYHGLSMQPFQEHCLALNDGDAVVLFSDGLADQFGGPNGKKLKHKSLEQLISEKHHIPMDQMGRSILDLLNNWKGNLEQVDDVCVAGIRF